MKTKVISCDVFRWMFNETDYPNYDFTYIEVARHNEPLKLNKALQQLIDESSNYENIILLYGLCGNSIIGLTSKVPLYVFRAHDCSSILLGNRSEFINHRWCSDALYKCEYYGDLNNSSYEEYVEKYGEHADYLWEMLKKDDTLYYVTMNTDSDDETMKNLEKEGYTIEKVLVGTDEVVKAMLNRQKHPMIFELTSNKQIEGVYDFEEIITMK